MNATLERLKTKFNQALIAAFGPELAGTDPMLVSASNPKFGDYQSNVALALAKELGQPPRAIAEQVAQHLSIADICDPPVVAGPGFINLALKPSYLESQLAEMQADSRLGVPPAKAPKRVVIDFSSPNIAKEMHVGHLRSTILGDCLARIVEFQGHDVLRLNHMGDWGTQFGMLIAYLKEIHPAALTTSNALDLGDLVTLYRQAKQRFDQDEAFQKTARQEVVKLQAGEPTSQRAWQLLCKQSRREFQRIYNLLDVKLTERGESFYNPLLPAVVSDLERSGLLVEDNGAKCVFLKGFTNREGKPQPLIIQKSDGGYNYATTDLAALHYRIQQDQANWIIYVTDAGQANHFAQVFQVAQRAGWIPAHVTLVHVPFGLVLGEGGRKLQTRSGDTIRLQELLDEAIARARADLETRLKEESREETPEFINHVAQVVGIGAVKYADLSQNRTSNYVFSYNRMLALQGNTAPYMIYAYVRVQGISRKISPPPPPDKTSLITGVALALIPLVVLAVTVLEAINTIPLFAPTLESIGCGYLSWFVFRYLLLAKTRQKLSQRFQVLREQIVGKKHPKTLSEKWPIVLKEETELALAKHLLQFSEVLESVAADLLPNRLCQYLFELSQKFNQFYDRCPVLTAPEPLQTSRLALCDLTARTLRLGLSLLGIQVLERM